MKRELFLDAHDNVEKWMAEVYIPIIPENANARFSSLNLNLVIWIKQSIEH